MAITFPRELPDVGFVTADFALADAVKASPSGARLINYTQVADPAWRATLATAPMVYSKFAEVEAWWLSLRDKNRVLFRHPHVCYPKNHRGNQTPADDAGNLVSVTSGNILAVDGVDAGLSLVVGDRVGLERVGRYHIGRITEVAGAGTTRTITIEPPPFDTAAVAGAVVSFARPALVMRPVPSSWSVSQSGSRYVASFQLVEAQ
tara:strand:+ start:22453 stop:23067 length:615 start_codon:yes stop_codon:yes gene_type:complete